MIRGQTDPRRCRGRLAQAATLGLCLAAVGLTGCQQTQSAVDPARAYQPLQPAGVPARSLVMPPLPATHQTLPSHPVPSFTPTHTHPPATPNPWYASRLDHGPAAFSGFRSTRIIESQTRTFDQQLIFSGRVRDNFRQQRVTRSRIISSQ